MSSDHRTLIRFFNTFEPVTSIYADMIPALIEAGFDIEVLQSRSEYRSGRAPLDKRIDSIHFRWIRIPAGFRHADTHFKKVLAAITFAIGSALYSLFGRRASVNVFLTQPPLFSFWGVVLKRLKGDRYACLIMDVYPDCAIEMGALRRGSALARYAQHVSRMIWRQSSGVIVIGRCMRDYVAASGVPAQQIHVIGNWVNEIAIQPIEPQDNPLRQSLGLQDDFVVLYSGNMGRAHYFDGILEAAHLLRDLPGLKFLFIGQGARRREIESVCGSDGMDHIILMEPQSEQDLQYSLGLGDIHFISLRDNFRGLVVPSKAYGAFAAARPVIYQGDSRGEIAQLIIEKQIGIVVGQSDHTGLVDAIRAYYDSRNLVKEQGKRARDVAESQCSYQEAAGQYHQLLQQLIEGTRQ